MRLLELIDSKGNLVPFAYGKILAEIVFPNDAASRRQAMLLFQDEQERFDKLGGLPRYQPTGLIQRVVTSLNGEAGQRAVAGYATIAMAILKARSPGKEIKLYGAAKVVEKALKVASKDDAQPLKMAHLRDGDWVIQGQRCPNTRKGIEDAWRAYSGVSHLIAADAILAEWFPIASVFQRPPEQTISLLRTASMFEMPIREAVEAERGGELVSVAHQFADAKRGIAPLPLGNALIDFISTGLPT